jgi:hypothetical protein
MQGVFHLKKKRIHHLCGNSVKGTLRYCLVLILLSGIQIIDAQVSAPDSTSINRNDTSNQNQVLKTLQQRWSLIQEKSIDSLIFLKSSTRFNREIRGLLFRKSATNEQIFNSPSQNHDLLTRDGKIIRRIDFKGIDMFASSIMDTTLDYSSEFEASMRKIHTNTRRKVLQNYLLFKPDEPLDIFLISENERILREQPFIMDARFLVNSTPDSPDSVDLLLVTQDLLPVGFGVELSDLSTGNLSIWHQNILGYGHQVMATTYWDAGKPTRLGLDLSYRVANIAGSFAAGKIEYIDKWHNKSFIIQISRDFNTARFNYAGGGYYENTTLQRDFQLFDTTLADIHLKVNNYDFWAGRKLSLNRKIFGNISSDVFLTARFHHISTVGVPEDALYYLYQYQNKTRLFFSSGLTHQGFKKDNLIYTFGRTEDVPFGYILEFTTGIEWGEVNSRLYFSGRAAYGNYLRNSDYIFGQVRLGSFIHKQEREQGILDLRLEYFTRIKHFNQFQYRHFITFNYINGINRYPGEFISLSGKGGIEGLESKSLCGYDKLSFNFESVLFSPFKLLGFRFALFGSLDMGLVTAERSILSDPEFYSGINIGMRIRNDQLVFDTFIIRFSFYPGHPADADTKYLSIGTLPRMRFNNFFPNKPDIISYL